MPAAQTRAACTRGCAGNAGGHAASAGMGKVRERAASVRAHRLTARAIVIPASYHPRPNPAGGVGRPAGPVKRKRASAVAGQAEELRPAVVAQAEHALDAVQVDDHPAAFALRIGALLDLGCDLEDAVAFGLIAG